METTPNHGWKCKSSLSHMFFKIVVLKNIAIFTRKHLRWSLFLIKLQTSRPVTSLKGDSSTGVPANIARFLRTPILKNTCERLLLKFMKVFFDSRNRHYHSGRVMKNVFHVDFVMRLHLDICHGLTKVLTNKIATIAGSTNNLVWHFKKIKSLGVRKEN